MSGAVGPVERSRVPRTVAAPAAPGEPDPPWSPAVRAAAYALVVVLAVLLALWGSFLVPFRVGGTLVPVSWVLAVLGNVAVGRAAAALAGSTGVLPPALLWLVVAFTLASRRAEGDVVVPGTVVGLGFLLLGVMASAAVYGRTVLRPRG